MPWESMDLVGKWGRGEARRVEAELRRVRARERGRGQSDFSGGAWRESAGEQEAPTPSRLTLSKVATKSRMRMRM